MDIAAGEYGYTLAYFEKMLAAGAVDCLQADVTRCEGITGFLRVAALCEAHSLELSAHCGPSIHVHPCCAVGPLRHLEYFHDHVRVERLLFDGVLEPVARRAATRPDPPGKRAGAQASRRTRDTRSDEERERAMRPNSTEPPRAGAREHPRRPDAAFPRGADGVERAAARASRSTSSITRARSATSGCGRRSS